MPAHQVEIVVDREAKAIKPGAVRGKDILALADIGDGEQLLLEVPDDVDIPLAADDLIIIRGNETFSVGDGKPHIDDNPLIRNPVEFTLNGGLIPEHQRSRHAKITGAGLKGLAGGDAADLWIDLDGIADELIEANDRIVLQKVDHFFTVAREHEDRFYDVTVLLDGEAKHKRFPAEMTVREAVRRCLPPHDRNSVNDFDLVDADIGTTPLAFDVTLRAAGVRDGHTLSITKKNGGGGEV